MCLTTFPGSMTITTRPNQPSEKHSKNHVHTHTHTHTICTRVARSARRNGRAAGGTRHENTKARVKASFSSLGKGGWKLGYLTDASPTQEVKVKGSAPASQPRLFCARCASMRGRMYDVFAARLRMSLTRGFQ